ncbi:hypothetical protein OAK75_12670 [Bacteriovoracales bacterium]|nr:hypothetical protein [Bacteriovoracales bacterium]
MKTFWIAMFITLFATSCSSNKRRASFYDASRSDAICHRYHFYIPSTECLHIR